MTDSATSGSCTVISSFSFCPSSPNTVVFATEIDGIGFPTLFPGILAACSATDSILSSTKSFTLATCASSFFAVACSGLRTSLCITWSATPTNSANAAAMPIANPTRRRRRMVIFFASSSRLMRSISRSVKPSESFAFSACSPMRCMTIRNALSF